MRSSQSRDGTWVSCIAGRLFTIWATRVLGAGDLQISEMGSLSSRGYQLRQTRPRGKGQGQRGKGVGWGQYLWAGFWRMCKISRMRGQGRRCSGPSGQLVWSTDKAKEHAVFRQWQVIQGDQIMRVRVGVDCWRTRGGGEHLLTESFVKILAVILQATGRGWTRLSSWLDWDSTEVTAIFAKHHK